MFKIADAWLRAMAIACVVVLGGTAPGVHAQGTGGKAAIGSEEDAALIAILIRSTLVALHQANVTGNYTVLRDLGAPSFRERNTAASLAANFASIRERQIGLQAVTILQPRISGTPVIDSSGLLRVTGSFPTKPVPIRFDLAFQVHERVWRLISIVVAPIPPGNGGDAPHIPIPQPRPENRDDLPADQR
ncbi:hypothetical protein M8R20_00280 [Pseudomonas sp. R2.Fl]|nr:hypothetical protein [Pseudomonas sp. R2.Fl]